MKKYNFYAGPSLLPREAVENTAKQILDFNGMGVSLMCVSHRSPAFQAVMDETVALIKELLDIPEATQCSSLVAVLLRSSCRSLPTS